MKEENSSIVIADIPGLIEGASEGKGLGFKFLKHIERNQILVHLIAIPQNKASSTAEQLLNNIKDTYQVVRNELERYGQDLTSKTEIIAINKIDLLNLEIKTQNIKKIEDWLKKNARPYVFISAQDNLGLNGLKKVIMQTLAQETK